MLARRYSNDGLPLLKLNPLQLKMKSQIEHKIKDGIYIFEKIPCSCCAQNDFELLSEKDRYGLYLPVVICRKCGLIQTNPRMNQEAYNSFYNSEYRELYQGNENPTEVFFRKQYRKGRDIYRFLVSKGLIEKSKPLCLLEVGCGAGGILQFFKEKGCSVQGIDLGDAYVHFGKEKYGLELKVATVHEHDTTQKFDLIIYSHVIEHILELDVELQKIKSFLSDSGILYVETPSVKNLMNSYNLDFLGLLQNAHVFHFTLKTLKNVFHKNGFEFVVGNEIINSVFKKVSLQKEAFRIESDYVGVCRYLKRMEWVRRILPMAPYKFKEILQYYVVKVIKQSLKMLPFTNNKFNKRAQ